MVSLGIRQKPRVPGDKVPGRQLLTKQTSTEKAIQRYDSTEVMYLQAVTLQFQSGIY